MLSSCLNLLWSIYRVVVFAFLWISHMSIYQYQSCQIVGAIQFSIKVQIHPLVLKWSNNSVSLFSVVCLYILLEMTIYYCITNLGVYSLLPINFHLWVGLHKILPTHFCMSTAIVIVQVLFSMPHFFCDLMSSHVRKR